MADIILGENFDFELESKSSNLSRFTFRVLSNGEDTGKKIHTSLYGISVPSELSTKVPTADRNMLVMSGIRAYKSRY